jgi:formylglycine-generating enzyme required for sulfatase activity
MVSWYEAVAYCRWLSDKLGYLVRLPTEAEWQQAATSGKENRVYPWGREWDAKFCNSGESGVNRTTLVGLYPHGTWVGGPLDMAGNVREWCLNKYEPYEDPVDSSSDYRALRGGSWLLSSVRCCTANRNNNNPSVPMNDVGFRVLCLPSGEH